MKRLLLLSAMTMAALMITSCESITNYSYLEEAVESLAEKGAESSLKLLGVDCDVIIDFENTPKCHTCPLHCPK